MPPFITIWFFHICSVIKQIYAYIFPEYPTVGIVVVAVSVVYFLIYLIKADLAHATKVGFSMLIVLSGILFCLHHLIKLLNAAGVTSL